MKVTKVDDFTVRFDFAVPNPSFALIHYSGPPVVAFRAKHYLSKLHPKYNPNAEAEAKAKGFDKWQARFMRSASPSANQSLQYGAMDPDHPVLDPWRPTRVDTQGQEYE